MSRALVTAAAAAIAAWSAGARTEALRSSGNVIARQTTTYRFVPGGIGYPIELEPEVLASAPSYARAVSCDARLEWRDAVGSYEQAIAELARAQRIRPSATIEDAVAKADMERQRSAILAHDASQTIPRAATRSMTNAATATDRRALLSRGRLLRLKLMTVRAQTGIAAAPLVAETLRALRNSLATNEGRQSQPSPMPADEVEARLLLCATRAAIGDSNRATEELAHVAPRERDHPDHAPSAAACLAALDRNDEALSAIAVATAVHRSFGSLRISDSAGRQELRLSNDWDRLRRDARFTALFR